MKEEIEKMISPIGNVIKECERPDAWGLIGNAVETGVKVGVVTAILVAAIKILDRFFFRRQNETTSEKNVQNV